MAVLATIYFRLKRTRSVCTAGLTLELIPYESTFVWEHFSNGGQIYMTNGAVIGPESLNWVFGVRFQL